MRESHASYGTHIMDTRALRVTCATRWVTGVRGVASKQLRNESHKYQTQSSQSDFPFASVNNSNRERSQSLLSIRQILDTPTAVLQCQPTLLVRRSASNPASIPRHILPSTSFVALLVQPFTAQSLFPTSPDWVAKMSLSLTSTIKTAAASIATGLPAPAISACPKDFVVSS